MKKIFAILMILLLPTFLFADVAVWVTKAEAEKSAVLIKKQKEIKIFCGACADQKDEKATTATVKEVKAEQVPDEAKYWHVLVNGEEQELASVYYKTDDGRWRNVAVAVGIKVEVLDISKDVTEFIPDAALKKDN